MIPKGAEGIGHIATRIAVDLMPKAADAYAGADMGLIATLLGLVAQDYDRAADNLVADHADIASILREAQPHLTDASLRRRAEAAASATCQTLRVHDLAARGDIEMRVLIDLHETVEKAMDEGAAWAHALNARIWRFLDEYVARRTYQSAF